MIEYGCIYGQVHIQEIWKAPVQRLKNQHSANSGPTVHSIVKWGPRVENTLISQKICDVEGICPLATDGLPVTLLISLGTHLNHRRCPNDPNRTSVEDQLMIAELRLYKNRQNLKRNLTTQNRLRCSSIGSFHRGPWGSGVTSK